MSILATVGEQDGFDRIIETGFDLAAAYDDELHILHVIPKENAEEHLQEIKSIDEFRDSSFTVEIDRAEAIAASLSQTVLSEKELEQVTPVGSIGDPTEEILSTASTIEPRYIVIGGRKRSPVGKALFGSVTQSVILNTDRPVVAVPTNR
jgi:nucleotide-binding universal stress UspA family protein